jgi:AAA15 family ATPase/GTPase
MINKVSIKNFRCFHQTQIEGFAQINLISGLNNAGKTAFLEALLLNGAPSLETILTLRELRGEENEYAKLYPEYTWDSLFNNQNKEEKIEICTNFEEKDEQTLQISVMNEKELEEIFSGSKIDVYKEKVLSTLLASPKTTHDDKITPTFVTFFPIISEKEGLNEFNEFEKYRSTSSFFKHVSSETQKYSQYKMHFIPVSYHKKGAELAREYSKAERVNKANLVKKAIQLVDKTITDINVSVLNGINLVLKREGENSMPVSMFGDAINKIVNIILTVINNNSSVLLIDEIENGIHYTVQREFWTYLFKLAKELNIQIFATTHSLEMIRAFADVAKEEFQDETAYFEFIRHIKTHEIDANRHDLATLTYELNHKLAIRGE